MPRYSIACTVAALAICALASPALAQGDGCSTDRCHSDMGKGTWVHGPVGVGACTICHSPVEGQEHAFTLSAEKQDLCFACHEDSRDMMLLDSLHTPVAQGDCVGCHDPHQSEFKFTLKGNAADLCYQCHEEEPFKRAHVHGPVAGGDCNVCHNPHASNNANQLVSAPEQICMNCHQEKDAELGMRHVHPPVAEACVRCHDPHSQNVAMLLPEERPQLCYECHQEIAAHATASQPHSPVSSGRCEDCHDAHASDSPKLFPVAATELCAQCHDELGAYISDQPHLHGPVAQGDCNACHDPHGSENPRILRKFFPAEFYTPYVESNYDMCFECHNRDFARDPETTTLTGFRDGEENLHWLHVNREKGRSCKACHQVHASSQEKHVRTSVPYGSIKWELPVIFTKTDDGGSCNVGCHAPKEYRRR